MLLHDNNLPLIVVGQGAVSDDLVNFLRLENRLVKSVSFEEAQNIKDKNSYQYILGVLSDMHLRKKIIDWFEVNQLSTPSYVHTQAMVDNRSMIPPGCVIYATSYLQNATLGKYCFLSAFSLVSHGSLLGRNVVLYPYACCLGSCQVGNDTLLQTRATISNKMLITVDNVNLLPMTFVNKNISVSGTYGGSTAKLVTAHAC